MKIKTEDLQSALTGKGQASSQRMSSERLQSLVDGELRDDEAAATLEDALAESQGADRVRLLLSARKLIDDISTSLTAAQDQPAGAAIRRWDLLRRPALVGVGAAALALVAIVPIARQFDASSPTHPAAAVASNGADAIFGDRFDSSQANGSTLFTSDFEQNG